MSYASNANKKSPLGMTAALLANTVIIGGLIISTSAVFVRDEPGITIGKNIPHPKPPEPKTDPEVADQPKPLDPIFVPKPLNDPPIKKPNDIRTTSDPLPPPTGVADGEGKTGTTPGTKIEDPPETKLPPVVEPPAPVIVAARLDPRYARDLQPTYPPRLLQQEVEGTARVRVLVGTDGRVKQAVVLSATKPAFGEAAVKQALGAWRFIPATKDGKPVEDWLVQKISFQIT